MEKKCKDKDLIWQMVNEMVKNRVELKVAVYFI